MDPVVCKRSLKVIKLLREEEIRQLSRLTNASFYTFMRTEFFACTRAGFSAVS